MGINIEHIYDLILNYKPLESNIPLILQTIKLQRKEEMTYREIIRLTQSYLRVIFEYFATNKFLNPAAYLKGMQ